MEGVLEALFGALLAIGALQAGITFLLPKLADSLSFLAISLSSQVVLSTYGLLVVVGILLGLFGSAIAMRRYLKV
jgi:cell division transport system permease protein